MNSPSETANSNGATVAGAGRRTAAGNDGRRAIGDADMLRQSSPAADWPVW